MPDKSNKSNRERKKEGKKNNNNNIYSSKHVRIKEKELSKEKDFFFLI
jgi:hypothetical protein